MLKFVLPVLLVAASSAQTFFYPTHSSSSMYRYGGYSSYYPSYMPTTYIRSGYFYPYSRHMTMAYPTFMARSDDAIKPEIKSHHVVRPIDTTSTNTMTGHHMPVTVQTIADTPVHHHHHQHGQVAMAVPAAITYGYSPVPVSSSITKDMIPTVPTDVTPVTAHRHVAQPPVSYAVPVTFEYPVTSGRVEPSTVGITGGASFVSASGMPVDVKSGFDVPSPVVSTHHETKHNNFEGKKTSTF